MNCAWCSDRIINDPVYSNLSPNLAYHKTCWKKYRDFLDHQLPASIKAVERRGKFKVIQGGKSGNRTQE